LGNNGKITTRGLLNTIQQIKPEIGQIDLERFESDKAALGDN